MRLSLPSFAAGALAATVLLAVPATALVASTATTDPHPTTYDGTSPSLTLGPVEFVVGSSIDAADLPAAEMCDSQPWNVSIPLRLRWSGSDATSGLAGYDVWGTGPSFNGSEKLVNATSATTYGLTGYNYEGDCGGGSAFDKAFWVVAKDNRGNTASTNLVSPNVTAWQETGADPVGDAGIPVTRTGTWTVASCSCFNNGKTLYSTAAGASLSYKVTTTRPGQTVAIVVEKNSNRGTANISVDGGTATAVNTQASSATHRVVVWQKVLSVGTHTVKVTNAGTSGHSRVDVDAVLLTVGQGTSSPPEPQSGP
jgi:hypothetical protein